MSRAAVPHPRKRLQLPGAEAADNRVDRNLIVCVLAEQTNRCVQAYADRQLAGGRRKLTADGPTPIIGEPGDSRGERVGVLSEKSLGQPDCCRSYVW